MTRSHIMHFVLPYLDAYTSLHGQGEREIEEGIESHALVPAYFARHLFRNKHVKQESLMVRKLTKISLEIAQHP